MTGPSGSRRRFLAGIAAAGTAASAGCSGLPFGGETQSDDDRVSLSSDVIGEIDRPAWPFPVTTGGSLVEAHETRARDLLAEVPADPDIPNAAVAAQIGDDRERALQRTNADPPEEWPADALAEWRRRRGDAATVHGAYRAATGVDDGADLVARRRAIREDRATLAADLEYRAGSIEEAVLAYEPVESLLAASARFVEPRVSYPADPVAEPFQAGEVAGDVERARATVADAAGLRSAYLDEEDEASPRWASLIAAAGGLRGSVSRTHSTVRGHTNGGASSSDEDLSGTVAQELLTVIEGRVERTVEDVREASDAGEHATVAAESGVALATIDALRTADDEVSEGKHAEAPTESSVRAAAERALRGRHGGRRRRPAGDPVRPPGLRDARTGRRPDRGGVRLAAADGSGAPLRRPVHKRGPESDRVRVRPAELTERSSARPRRERVSAPLRPASRYFY